MRTFITYSLLFLCFTGFSLVGFTQNFEKHISALCADSLSGRMPGSLGEKGALNYIMSQITPAFKLNSQQFEFTDLGQNKNHGTNLICSSDLKIETDSSILFIAHYDHLGAGAYKSLEILQSKKKKIHPGADDNASGVAMVLELGNWYVSQNKLKYKPILLFTSAHEVGLFGAEHFVNSFNVDSLKLKAVFNFDMVGRLDENSRSLSVSDNQKDLNFYESISSSLKISKGDLINNSDLKHFASYPLHLVSFTTGIHDDYHRITDTPDKINYEGMQDIFEFIKTVLKNLA